jgi:hypothetical protein
LTLGRVDAYGQGDGVAVGDVAGHGAELGGARVVAEDVVVLQGDLRHGRHRRLIAFLGVDGCVQSPRSPTSAVWRRSPASSGKTNRHRLNRGGNRDANRALYVLALGRLSYDERTREYAARRTAEGKTKREIIRCIKRYLAREYKALLGSPAATAML